MESLDAIQEGVVLLACGKETAREIVVPYKFLA